MRKVIKIVSPAKQLRIRRPEYISVPVPMLDAGAVDKKSEDPDIVDKITDAIVARLKQEGVIVDANIFEAAKQSVANDLSRPGGLTVRRDDGRVVRVSRDRSHVQSHIQDGKEEKTSKPLAKDVVEGLAAILGKEKK